MLKHTTEASMKTFKRKDPDMVTDGFEVTDSFEHECFKLGVLTQGLHGRENIRLRGEIQPWEGNIPLKIEIGDYILKNCIGDSTCWAHCPKAIFDKVFEEI